MAKFWMLVVPLFSAAIAFAADTTTNYPRNPVAGEKVWVNPPLKGNLRAPVSALSVIAACP